MKKDCCNLPICMFSILRQVSSSKKTFELILFLFILLVGPTHRPLDHTSRGPWLMSLEWPIVRAAILMLSTATESIAGSPLLGARRRHRFHRALSHKSCIHRGTANNGRSAPLSVNAACADACVLVQRASRNPNSPLRKYNNNNNINNKQICIVP